MTLLLLAFPVFWQKRRQADEEKKQKMLLGYYPEHGKKILATGKEWRKAHPDYHHNHYNVTTSKTGRRNSQNKPKGTS